MLEPHHVESAKTYVVGASAMVFPPVLTMLTPWLQFVTMVGGLLIVVLRGYYDYKEHKKKNNS